MSADSVETDARLSRRGLRLLVRLLRAAAIGYLALLVLLPFVQKYLIFPGTLMQAPAPTLPPSGAERLTLKLHDGSKVAAMFVKARSPANAHAGKRLPTVLYFYGNASTLAESSFEIDLFRDCGANILVADYPGYGLSPGSPSETACYATADALWDYAMSRDDVDRERVICVGWSLGGAVAIDLAWRRPVAAIMTLSSFTSLDAMAHRQMPYMPTNLLLRHHFRNVCKLSGLRVPITIAHGDIDQIVPFEMSRELHEASASSPARTYLPIRGAGHDDIFAIGHTDISSALHRLIALTGNGSH